MKRSASNGEENIIHVKAGVTIIKPKRILSMTSILSQCGVCMRRQTALAKVINVNISLEAVQKRNTASLICGWQA